MKRKRFLLVILIIVILELFLFSFFYIYNYQFKLSFSPNGFINKETIIVPIEDISKETYEDNIRTYQKNTKKCKSFPIAATYNTCQGFFYEKSKHYDWGWDYSAVIFLECHYEIFEFEQEINRIKEFSYEGKQIVYVEDLFSIPAYVVAYNWDSLYEYALVDEANCIIRYIYLFDSGENVSIPNDFFPKKLLRNSSFPKQGLFINGYNCYE